MRSTEIAILQCSELIPFVNFGMSCRNLMFWIRLLIAKVVYSARAKKVFSQSAHLLTLSITNQNTQRAIENEEKISFHLGRKQSPNHRAFAVEKNSSHRKPVWQVVFRFSREFFTLSGSRYNFLNFYCFPSQNIVVKLRYLLL